MNKKLKIIAVIKELISIFLSFIAKRNTKAKVSSDNVNLVLDSLNHIYILPKKFRKTTNLIDLKNNINMKDLDKLNVSASQQFSEYNFSLLIEAIGTSLSITVIDLRQESHGFLNGFAVSWMSSKNNANGGLIRKQVLDDEAKKLKSVILNKPITFYNHNKKTIIPIKVQDENEFVNSKSISYARITIKDGGMPSDEMVDYFMELVKSQTQSSWLHFHCKAGIGRTTTFMIMYDMIKNYKEVSAEDIINRQLALANFDNKKINSFRRRKRIDFLNKFYDYCLINGDSFETKWSEWKKVINTNENIKISNYNSTP